MRPANDGECYRLARCNRLAAKCGIDDVSHGRRQTMRGMKAWIAMLGLSSVVALGQPAQVILVRHGEKPDDDGAAHLSARGEERARALAGRLGKPSNLTSNAPIAALYATRVTKQDRSYRTEETLTPLSRTIRLPVQTPFHSKDHALLALAVLRNPAYHGKTVVICWTHHDLADLAADFGVKPQPPHWKDRVFDRFWVITFPHGHAEMRDLPQRLLKGDSKK